MGVYENYETDVAVENEGIWYPLDGFKLRIARAGGGNTAYLAAIAARADKFKGTTREMKESGVLAEVYAEAIITEVEDPNKNFVTREGKAIKVKSDEMVQVLQDLPDLFDEVVAVSSRRDLYRAEINSAKK